MNWFLALKVKEICYPYIYYRYTLIHFPKMVCSYFYWKNLHIRNRKLKENQSWTFIYNNNYNILNLLYRNPCPQQYLHNKRDNPNSAHAKGTVMISKGRICSDWPVAVPHLRMLGKIRFSCAFSYLTLTVRFITVVALLVVPDFLLVSIDTGGKFEIQLHTDLRVGHFNNSYHNILY